MTCSCPHTFDHCEMKKGGICLQNHFCVFVESSEDYLEVLRDKVNPADELSYGEWVTATVSAQCDNRYVNSWCVTWCYSSTLSDVSLVVGPCSDWGHLHNEQKWKIETIPVFSTFSLNFSGTKCVKIGFESYDWAQVFLRNMEDCGDECDRAETFTLQRNDRIILPCTCWPCAGDLLSTFHGCDSTPDLP